MTWRRADHMARIDDGQVFDVVIVGGGIVGAGIALDCATRGMTTALVERTDFASGTSSRSSKLFHGGIRYLPQLRFGLVREGLVEQKVLAEIADYLYQPLEFLLPVYEDRGFGDMPEWLSHPKVIPAAFSFGLWFYDRLGGRPTGSHDRIEVEEVLSLVPHLRPDGMTGGFLYDDAKTDDARLVLAVTKTAVDNGVTAVNWLEATSISTDGPRHLVHGRCGLTGTEISIPTRSVVAATGAFDAPGVDGDRAPIDIIRSKGVHATLASQDLPTGDRAVVLPETEDGRVIFVVPWLGTTMVGTTDTPFDNDVAHPTATDEDLDYLERHLEMYFTDVTFNPISAWAGLRALAARSSTDTAKASRKHKVVEAAPGYFQVAGGKLTGYRAIADEITDDVANYLDIDTKPVTKALPLYGSGSDLEQTTKLVVAAELPSELGRVLHDRYGAAASAVLDVVAEEERFRQPLGDGHVLLGEVAYAARHESVAALSDMCLRRSRLSWFTRDHGRGHAGDMASVLASELEWSEADTEEHLRRFEAELVAEGL